MNRTWYRGLLVWLLCAGMVGAAPDWLDDPEAKWICFGGESGIAESAGITLRPAGKEGILTPAERGGESCARSLIGGTKMGYFYLVAPPWQEVSEWLGDDELLLTVRYFDGAPGTMYLQYDSADERVRRAPYPAGVWKFPPGLENGLPLRGNKSWQTLQVRLPLAYFQRRLHGGDIRIHSRGEDFALAGVALTRVPKEGGPELLMSQMLRVASVEGMVSFGTGARFAGTFAQNDDGSVVMEAELATDLSIQDGRTLGVDERASGGGYIHFVESATWRFTVSKPGRYVMWQRALFPWGGNWNHAESMNQESGAGVTDYTESVASGWKWVRTRDYDLTAGEHSFNLSYHGGAQLDVLVLAPEGAGEPVLGEVRSSYVGGREATILTSRLQPLHVASWQHARLVVAGLGESRIEALADTAPEGIPVPADGSLAGIAVGEPGASWIQFRITCGGEAGATPQFFGGGTVTYIAGSENVRYVEAGPWRIGFDGYGIASIEDTARNAIVSKAPPMHAALISLVTKAPGLAASQTVDLYDSQLDDFTATPEEDGSVTVSMTHRLSSGILLHSRARFLGNGQSEWQLGIENPTGSEVAEVQFPVVTGVRLGDMLEDDFIFMAKCWGQIWQHPAADRLATHWGTSMRWISLWDEGQGLYLGIEDPRFDDYAFACGGDAGGTTVATRQRIRVAPNGSWSSGIYRLALVDGGSWHPAADIYRDYVAGALRPNPPLAHVRWLLDGWDYQQSNDAPYAGWDMIVPKERYFMAANRQMVDGADSGYCGLFPYPSPSWGSIAEFQEKLAFLRARGDFYTPYYNFHLWSPGYGHYDRIGSFPKSALPEEVPKPDDGWYERAVARTYDGSFPRVQTDPFAQIGMSMGSREWREWLAYWTARYLGWGADGMYYDQFNMIYGDGQLHADFPDAYGSWMKATLLTMRNLQESSRRIHPWYTASGEVCNDVYGQYLDLHMTSGVFNRLDVYSYCNPEQILIDGNWNGGTAAPYGGPRRWRFIWQVGARFEGDPGEPIMALRRAVKSHLYAGRFMDTAGLTVTVGGKTLVPERLEGKHELGPVSGTIGRWFLIDHEDQRGAIVNFINDPLVRNAVARIDTRRFGPVRAAMAWTVDGKRMAIHGTQEGDIFTFAVPAAELSSVVLANRLAPVVEWEHPRATHAGNREAFRISLVNVSDRVIGGSARLRLPPEWEQVEEVKFGPLAPGAQAGFTLPWTVPANAPVGRFDLWCDLVTDTGSFAAYALPTINRGVAAMLSGSPGTYHLLLHNRSDRSVVGSLTVTAPPPLTVEAPAAFAIPPRGELRVPIQVKGHEELGAIGELTATVDVEGQRLELHRAVLPPLPNPDFESDTAGDMKPDWWMCRKLRDAWAYERLHLSTEAYSGTYSLQLDPPQPGEEYTCAYPVHSALAPNTRYRVSIWIRTAATDGVFVRVQHQHLGNQKTGGDAWRHFTAEFTTGNTVELFYRMLYNYSSVPAYFDDFQIEKIE